MFPLPLNDKRDTPLTIKQSLLMKGHFPQTKEWTRTKGYSSDTPFPEED